MCPYSEARPVFFLSDGTGLTAASYGKSLLAQFKDVTFHTQTIPFVDGAASARRAAAEIVRAQERSGRRAIVFSTLVTDEVQQVIEASGAFIIDLFNAFIGPLEQELGCQSAHSLGQSYDVFGDARYQQRMDAIEFALAHDDGMRPDHYAQADVILVGVSRCGKTPTSLYLAMNFSLKACNYPLTGDELQAEVLPPMLVPWRSKLVGLTIDPVTLRNIREKRRSSAQYCALEVCRREVRAAEEIFKNEGLPVFESTETSIEELAGGILRWLRRSQGSMNRDRNTLQERND